MISPPKTPTTNDAGPIVVKRQLTRQQYFRFLVSYSYSKWYVLTAIFLAATYAVYAASTGNNILPWAVLVFLFLLFYSPFYALFTVRNKKNRKIFLPITYSFDNEGVTAEMPLGKESVKWGLFRDWKKIGGCYALIISANSLVAIPEVDIPIRDRERFDALLRQKIREHS